MTDLDLAAIRERIERADGVTHKRLSDEDRAQAWSAFFDYAMDDLCDCLAEIDRLNATIQRVRELHMESNVCDVREHTLPGSSRRCGDCMAVCTECHRHWEGYPCPTIRALEGGEQ